jgi:hypothetical protein
VKAGLVQQWSGRSALLGGLLWSAAGGIAVADITAAQGIARLLTAVALALLVPGVAALYERWRVQGEPLSTIAAFTAGGGIVVTCVDLLTALLQRNAIRDVLVSPIGAVGVLLICGGLLLLGSVAMVGDQVRSWQSTLLLVGLVGLFLPLGAGVAGTLGSLVWIVWGLGWTWLGAILMIEGRRAVLVPVREF